MIIYALACAIRMLAEKQGLTPHIVGAALGNVAMYMDQRPHVKVDLSAFEKGLQRDG